MPDTSITAGMKDAWNRRAGKDPFHYVETEHWDGDIEKFFGLGEARAKLFLDPILASLGIDAGAQTALDFGCGVGRFSRVLSRRFARVIGIDVSEEMIRVANELQAGRDGHIDFRVGDGVSVPVEDRCVDFAFSYEVFQHFPAPEIAASNFREIARALRPGGHALIHCKTGEEPATLLQSLYRRLPRTLSDQLAPLLGRDPLKRDAAYRGTILTLDQITAMCRAAALEILDFRPDPTHDGTCRTFVLARPKPM